MRFLQKAFALIALMLSLSAGFAQAKTEADWTACRGGDTEASIAACDRLIASRQIAAHDRAIAYFHRGSLYLQRKNFDQAIKDFTEALIDNPRHANALAGRGEALIAKGELQKGLADFAEALRTNPRDPVLRGRLLDLLYVAGDFHAVITHADYLMQTYPSGYHALARYTGLIRTGRQQNANDKLAYDNRTYVFDWPKPLVEMMLGMKTPEAARAEAVLGQKCEAAFYIGLYFTLKGDKSAGAKNFTEASELCKDAPAFAAMATFELQLLEK